LTVDLQYTQEGLPLVKLSVAVKRILASALTLLPLPALATLPASAAQVFCTGTVVVVARVQAGTSEDCRLHYFSGNCSPEDGVRLSIVVSEILAVSKDYPASRSRLSQ
jgi:hypothetical protein